MAEEPGGAAVLPAAESMYELQLQGSSVAQHRSWPWHLFLPAATPAAAPATAVPAGPVGAAEAAPALSLPPWPAVAPVQKGAGRRRRGQATRAASAAAGAAAVPPLAAVLPLASSAPAALPAADPLLVQERRQPAAKRSKASTPAVPLQPGQPVTPAAAPDSSSPRAAPAPQGHMARLLDQILADVGHATAVPQAAEAFTEPAVPAVRQQLSLAPAATSVVTAVGAAPAAVAAPGFSVAGLGQPLQQGSQPGPRQLSGAAAAPSPAAGPSGLQDLRTRVRQLRHSAEAQKEADAIRQVQLPFSQSESQGGEW
jgi:hypothetical protein